MSVGCAGGVDEEDDDEDEFVVPDGLFCGKNLCGLLYLFGETY